MVWYISKQKLKFEGVESFQELDQDIWQKLVDNDDTLIWFENTKHGSEFFNDASVPENFKHYRKNAHYDISKKYGHGMVQLKFNINNSHIWIMHTRETLSRIEKYFEIAKKLDASLYKNMTLIDEKQMDKIREKYRVKKHGSRAPKDK